MTPDNPTPVASPRELAREFRVGTHERRRVFVEVRLRDADSDAPSLSVTGHTQFRSADDWHEAGQIIDTVAECEPHGAWTRESIDRLVFVWRLYHLNDMQAGCEHQRLARWTYDDHSERDWPHRGKPCPICGYRIGSAWKYMPLPADVLALVRAWIDADEPATA